MSRNVVIGLIIIFAITSIALGFLIYKRYATSAKNYSTVPSTQQGYIPLPTPTKTPYSNEYINQLTEGEKKLVKLDLGDTNVLRANSGLINYISKATDTLDISNCEPKPLVIKLQKGAKLYIKNNDPFSHSILAGDYGFPASASSKIQVSPNFLKGAGIYSYTCDQAGARGIFYIIP